MAANPTDAMSRRSFLVASIAAGGGLLLSATFPSTKGSASAAGADASMVTMFARISPSGVVTILPNRGRAGYQDRAADDFRGELDVAWKDVVIEMADYQGGKMGSRGSGGSYSTPATGYRAKGQCRGRQMLIGGPRDVPPQMLDLGGIVNHLRSGARSYSSLAEDASRSRWRTNTVALKDETAFRSSANGLGPIRPGS